MYMHVLAAALPPEAYHALQIRPPSVKLWLAGPSHCAKEYRMGWQQQHHCMPQVTLRIRPPGFCLILSILSVPVEAGLVFVHLSFCAAAPWAHVLCCAGPAGASLGWLLAG